MAGIEQLVLTQGLFEKYNQLFVTALGYMLKRGDPVAISGGFFGPRLNKNFHHLDVILPAILQNHCLDQGCPFKVIDVSKRRAAAIREVPS